MRRIFSIAVVAGFVLMPVVSGQPAATVTLRQTAVPSPLISPVLASMTPEQRVGQLFIVTFRGTDTGPGSDIHELISEHFVGGVALLASNDNITDTVDLPAQVITLTTSLQTAAYDAWTRPQGAAPAETPAATRSGFVPLFIAMAQEGDGYPYSQIYGGLTELPSPMAIGATWDPARARSVGEIAGRELSALGINLLLGPSLDVLDNPRPANPGDLGTRTFGGDPYWVGVMGRAYIEGVHTGSNQRLAVVSGHFPGLGGSDRRAEDEVPTVRKSLEQLKQIELAPFFAVTGDAAQSSSTTDALLVSHIRYQGLQGNIRATTRPITFDAQALEQLLVSPQFVTWRASGGLLISDSLGVRAVKRFYDPSGATFPARRVALDAFLAGNDVLLLSDFGLGKNDQLQTTEDVLAFFVQKYREDPAFAARVDQAVTRVLNLKLRLAGQFSLEAVLSLPPARATEDTSLADVFSVAQSAATLISPSLADLTERLSEPPTQNEQLVIFTDVRQARQCSTCPPRPVVPVDAFQQAVLRLYGPQASGQVRLGSVQSFSFAELKDFLAGSAAASAGEGTPTTPVPIQTALDSAEWVVFLMLNVTPDVPTSDAVKAFLAERPDLARTKKVVVLALNAPYYLDTTEVSKLSAYYALYSRSPPFVEVAARLLFGELAPSGASPVSVQGIAYDLIKATAPDPRQVIDLASDQPTDAQGTPVPSGIRVGDTLQLRTGVIKDHNGHPVPDGTVVRFSVTYSTEGLSVPLPDVTTVEGVAHTALRLERVGQIEIRAQSDPALSSVILQLSVRETEGAFITVVAPTPLPTETPAPTESLAPPTATSLAQATPQPEVNGETLPHGVRWTDLMSMMIVMAVLLGAAYYLQREGLIRGGVAARLWLSASVGALLGYNFYAVGLPGSAALASWLGNWTATVLAWGGGLLGLAVGWLTPDNNR